MKNIFVQQEVCFLNGKVVEETKADSLKEVPLYNLNLECSFVLCKNNFIPEKLVYSDKKW